MWDSDGRFRRLQVDSVMDAAGKKLAFDFAQDSILVALPQKAAADEPVTVRYEISGNILIRPQGDNFWQLGTEWWFPQPGLNGLHFTVHSLVKVKKPWSAFAPGDTLSRKDEGDMSAVETSIDRPVQFAVVHAGKYIVAEEKYDDRLIRVASYAIANERAAKQLARLASQIIKFYEPWLGPFPFKEFNIIEINDFGFGQAPPGTLFITKEAFNPLISKTSRLYSAGVNQRFAHEIAHQYWGNVTKMGSWEEQWVTEAFAEYCSLMVVKEIEGQKGHDALLNRWRVHAKEAGDFAPIALANRIAIPSDPQKEYESRFGLLYSKGAYVLAALRGQMGDQKFFLLLRNLQGKFAGRFLTTKDIAELANRIDPGKDYQAFFERYFWGTEMPAMSK